MENGKLIIIGLILSFSIFNSQLSIAAVGFDNCSTSSGTGTSLTWSHTVTGSNTALIVTFHGEGDSAGQVSGITYNGVAMTLLQRSYPNISPGPGLEIYYLVAPATGAHNVVISNLNSIPYIGSSCSFTGVNQVTPTGTTVANHTDPLDSGSVTVPASGMAYEVDLWGSNGDCVVPTVAGGQTKRFDPCYSPSNNYLAFGATRTTTGNFTWNTSNSAYTASVAIPLNAATGVPARRRVVVVQ